MWTVLYTGDEMPGPVWDARLFLHLMGFVAASLLLETLNASFKVADKFNIIDKPNERSSHSSIVLRCGGLFSYCRCGFGARSSGFSICGSCLR